MSSLLLNMMLLSQRSGLEKQQMPDMDQVPLTMENIKHAGAKNRHEPARHNIKHLTTQYIM